MTFTDVHGLDALAYPALLGAHIVIRETQRLGLFSCNKVFSRFDDFTIGVDWGRDQHRRNYRITVTELEVGDAFQPGHAVFRKRSLLDLALTGEFDHVKRVFKVRETQHRNNLLFGGKVQEAAQAFAFGRFGAFRYRVHRHPESPALVGYKEQVVLRTQL